MKARDVAIDPLDTPETVMQRIVAVRFAELLQRSADMASGSSQGLHHMRIACKRLRYALEVFSEGLPRLTKAALTLRELQDTLGELHDCDILAETAQACSAERLYHRLLRDRTKLLIATRAKWTDAFGRGGGFTALIAYARMAAV